MNIHILTLMQGSHVLQNQIHGFLIFNIYKANTEQLVFILPTANNLYLFKKG